MFKPGDIVTNGYRFSDAAILAKLQVLAVDAEEVWVKALNGPFTGTRLTFPMSALVSA